MDRHDIIKQKIDTIKNLDRDFGAFGSDLWRYEFKKPGLAEIEKLESSHGVTLPVEFRNFILKIGFGAGPVYGVNPGTFLDIDKWEDDGDEEYQPLYDGFIVIAEHGCGKETMIIIDGKHKGEIWQNNDYGFEKLSDSYFEWYEKWLDNLTKILKSDGHIGILSGML